jgi:hypothetical protein
VIARISHTKIVIKNVSFVTIIKTVSSVHRKASINAKYATWKNSGTKSQTQMVYALAKQGTNNTITHA